MIGVSIDFTPADSRFCGIFIALGSNLGDRERHLRDALADLADQSDIRVVRCSTFHDTAPVGGPPGQPRYLNAVAELETALPPRDLLTRLLEIEIRHGRVRRSADHDVTRHCAPPGPERDAPRTLDLDLLLYHERVIDGNGLTVPHPRMHQREFVLRPLAEICDAARLRRAASLFTPGAGR